MSHHHQHDHSQAQGNIRVAFFLNLFFTIVEIIGGLLTNSMAILSDAVHDLGDSLSLGLSWFLQHLSEKGPDEKFSFGYARFSLLGALINSLVLVGGSALILSRAIPRIFNPEPVHATGMLLFSILGMIVNGAAAFRLSKGSSLNEKVVSWHLIEDVLGWAAVFVVSLVLLFVDLPILDPLLSLAITLYVLYNVVVNLKEVMQVFLQGVPGDYSIQEIEKKMVQKTQALSAYHTHLWSLEGEKNMVSTHLVVDDKATISQVIALKKEVRDLLADMDISHVTIEIDYQGKDFKMTPCDEETERTDDHDDHQDHQNQ